MIRFFKAAYRGVKNEILYSSADLDGMSHGDALNSLARSTASGKTVNAKTAMEISAAYDCVRKTAQALSNLPLVQYQKGKNGSREKVEDDLSEILTESPNRGQTALEFWEGQVAQICLRGNAYSERLFIGNRLVGLRPLFNVTPERASHGGFKYGIYDRGRKYYLPDDKVFHLRGFGPGDGMGMSTVAYGASSMGAALAADETASSVFSNAMMAAGFLSADQKLDAEQREQLTAILNNFVGSSRAGKTMVLESGLTHSPLQMNPGDAQLLETRRYSVEDVCRWFGVPPIVVGHSAEGQTMWGTGVESILISWLTLGINPLANRIEKRIKRDLMPPAKRRGRYFEFKREAMLQMDSKAKGDFLLKMRMAGLMTGDEGRDTLNMPRRGGMSDERFIQASMTPLDLIGKDEK